MSITEDVSGYPIICRFIKECGIGLILDYGKWIK